MRNAPQFSNLIYDFFSLRIQFGYYRRGDTLPTIDTLCRQFSVSAQTVKTALRRLRDEGYLSMRNGTSIKVTFQQTPQGEAEALGRFFSQRQAAMPDLCGTLELILVPLLTEGLRRTSGEDLDHLSRYVERAGVDDFIYFFCYVLQKLDNPLAMNLFWEIALFMGLLSIGEKGIRDREAIRKPGERAVACRRAEDWAGVRDALLEHQRESLGQAMAYVGRYVVPSAGQVPFVWRIYRERPQICYSLASRLLYDIYLGTYSGEEFLPSLEKMARAYRVSVSTMRRTVALLEQVGAVRPINGRGIRAFGVGQRCDAPNFESPTVRRNLAYFVQAYEIAVYSCEGVTRALLAGLTPEARAELIGSLEECRREGRCELSPWLYLICAATRSPLQGVREIYGRIYGLFLWGYPLKASSGGSEAQDRVMERFTRDTIDALGRGDGDGWAEIVKALAARQFQAAHRHLLRCGFRPEELRLTPSVRLVLAEEL